MRVAIVMGALAGLALAGCANEPVEDPAAQQRADAQAVQEIVAANTPPPFDPELQSMDYADFEREGLLGVSCAFVIDDEVMALAMQEVGALKYRGSVEQFAADAGSPEGPFDTRVKYDGRQMSFEMEVSGTQERTGEEVWSQPARLTVRDDFDRVVFQRAGTAECGS